MRRGVALAAAMASVGACAEGVREFEDGAHPPQAAMQRQALEPAAGAGSVSYVWTERSAQFTYRGLASVVDQPARGRPLLYGGWQENGIRFDTWEWDGSGWLRRRPLHEPGPRALAGAVWDSKRARTLLIGGVSEFAPALDGRAGQTTWEWDGYDWSEIPTVTAPSVSVAPALAYDPVRDLVWRFGGFTPGQEDPEGNTVSAANDELWAFDGKDWRQVERSAAWPPARGWASMAWDVERKVAVLHGGRSEIRFTGGRPEYSNDDSSQLMALNDTWEWNGTAWRLARTPEQNLETATTLHSSLYPAPDGAVYGLFDQVVFVGAELESLHVVRKYTADGWQALSTSPSENSVSGRRAVTYGVWSSANGGPLMSGGVRLTSGASIGWSADDTVVEGPTWRSLPPAVAPPALVGAAAANAQDGAIYMYGGLVAGRPSDDMYRWIGGRWTVFADQNSPGSRNDAVMVRQGERLVMIGGRTANTDLSWSELRGTGWTPHSASGIAERTGAAAFTLHGDVFLMGGRNHRDDRQGDIWKLGPTGGWSWTEPVPQAPDARGFACAIALPDDSAALLLGGNHDDLWRFDGASWSKLDNLPVRGDRIGCSLAVMPSTQTVVLLGGEGSSQTNDLWEMHPRMGVVTKVLTYDARTERPERRSRAVLAQSPSGGLIMFGGARNGDALPLDDTWQLRALGNACNDSASCGVGAFCTDGVCCDESHCGPCGTCAGSEAPGLCRPRPSGPQPGCDGEFACNDSGQCRLGAGEVCGRSDACGSGFCIKPLGEELGSCCAPEGCVTQCVDTQRLRKPDGSFESCAPYLCSVSACATSCRSIDDCAEGNVCDAEGRCVAAQPTPGQAVGFACNSTAVGSGQAGTGPLWAALSLSLAWLGRKRIARVGKAR